jgi:mRNA interferase HigB
LRVIKPSRVAEFIRRHPDAKTGLMAWLKDAKRAAWQSLIDVRQLYSHADPVYVQSSRTVTVFNIGGNKYRLITAIHYNTRILYVLRFLTHAEYSKNKWQEQL